MKSNCYKSFFFILFAIVASFSCNGEKAGIVTTDNTVTSGQKAGARNIIKIVKPAENASVKLKEQIKIIMSSVSAGAVPDSVVIYFDGKRLGSLRSSPWEYVIQGSQIARTGRKSIKITSFKDGRSQGSDSRFVIALSDIVPKHHGYKIIHTYPHSRDAFTQGLFYYKGLLYEGTGQESGSSLREVEPETGKVIRQLNIDPSLFGEGITLYQDRIFQVTWRNKVGFVYNRSDFRQLNKIYYPTEGWGLTTINNRIVMSDGTNVLYFYEPDMFTVASQIEVYDNSGKVGQLNELEYIDGVIWANIWMTDLIARIDPVSGKVLSYIDLKGLLPASERNPDTDVLNGIAYDSTTKRIFVTGKKWPRLYEIKVIE